MKSLDFFIVFVGLIIIYTCTLSLSSSKGLKKGKISKEVKAQAMKLLVEDLLIDQKEEEIAICSAIHNEGRWINEFILFHRLIGVDRFYLYDTGSDDDTIAVLTPWIRAGIVILHQFKECEFNSTNFALISIAQ